MKEPSKTPTPGRDAPLASHTTPLTHCIPPSPAQPSPAQHRPAQPSTTHPPTGWCSPRRFRSCRTLGREAPLPPHTTGPATHHPPDDGALENFGHAAHLPKGGTLAPGEDDVHQEGAEAVDVLLCNIKQAGRQAGKQERGGGVSNGEPPPEGRLLMYCSAGDAAVWANQLQQFVWQQSVAWIPKNTDTPSSISSMHSLETSATRLAAACSCSRGPASCAVSLIWSCRRARAGAANTAAASTEH